MKKFVLATANRGKINEMREILSKLGLEVITREELGIDIIIEETGSTFEENALQKAEAICAASGLPAIADDSGLLIEALDGGPGVYTSSYGGTDLTDSERCEYVLKKMQNKEQRAAKFVCTIVCVFPDGRKVKAEGECIGEITRSARGAGGFGYDPIFITKGQDCTNAELTPGEKNRLSHRGKALRVFSEKLKNIEI